MKHAILLSFCVLSAALPAYAGFREARLAAAAHRRPTDPSGTAAAILDLVDLPEPPLRLFLGTYPYPVAEKAYADRLETWHRWRDLAATADDTGAARR